MVQVAELGDPASEVRGEAPQRIDSVPELAQDQDVPAAGPPPSASDRSAAASWDRVAASDGARGDVAVGGEISARVEATNATPISTSTTTPALDSPGEWERRSIARET